jgi:hypothetical protein
MAIENGLVGRDWADTVEWLPEDLETLLVESAALKRRRSVRSGEALVRLTLAYSLLDFSLRSTAAWWASLGQPALSDVAVLKRLKSAPPFLELVLNAMLTRAAAGPVLAKVGLRVRLIDATTVAEPGSTGTDWRLHVGYDPAKGAIDSVQVTDEHGGESLDRAAASAGELILGDRGYAHSKKIRALATAGAHTLIRIGHQAVRMFDEAGTQLDPLAFASQRRALPGRPPRCESRIVWLHGEAGPPLEARLVVVRKSREATDRERTHLRSEAKRRGKAPTQRTLDAAAYTFLLTTLPENRANDEEIANLYRLRWQIELLFKRLKSLLNLDALRAKDQALARSYLLGKLIGAVLIQLIADKCRAISPYGVPLRKQAEPVA